MKGGNEMKSLKFKVKGAIGALDREIPGVNFYSASVKVPMGENEYGACGKSAILAVVGGSIDAVILEDLIWALWKHKTLPQFEPIDPAQVQWK